MIRRANRQSHNQPKTAKSSLRTPNSASVTFTEHIRELRTRLFWAVIISVVIGSVVYYYHDFFVQLVMAPLGDQKLIYLTPAGGFSFVFMVTFYITMLFSLPFILYQLYAFLRPAIPVHASRLSVKIALAATILMMSGAAFGYLFAVPGGLNFLSNFASEYVTASLTAESYLNFVLGYVLGIGALFELPLLLLFWHWIHPLTPKGLLNSERYVIVGAFIAAAILSPSPDALSQTVIAVPIIIVYQLGVVGVMLSIRKTKKLAKKVQGGLSHTIVEEHESYAREQRPVVSVSEVTETAAPVVHRRTPRRRAMDGMVVSTSPQVPKQGDGPGANPSKAAPRNALVVPRRSRMISDFGPIR